MKTYKIDLSLKGIKGLEDAIDNIDKLLDEDAFMPYLEEGCKDIYLGMCEMNLPIANEPDIQEKYMAGFQHEIDDNSVILSNDSSITISEVDMSPEKKQKYPPELSLAKIVEYGIGYSAQDSQYKGQIEDWQLDVNNHGAKGWYFKDGNGNIIWTDGFEGKFIFYKTKENIMQNADLILQKYVDNRLSGE